MKLEGLIHIQPNLLKDSRGFFLETYRSNHYKSLGIDCDFVQDNHSYSLKDTVRGMHFQSTPGQAKLVRCAHGVIFDVAVDIRPKSPTFGEWEGVILTSEKHNQLFIPIGFAHGFCVLSADAHVMYKVSANYEAKTEMGFRFDDPDIGIDWPVKQPLLSDRDKSSPYLKEIMAHS
jgi:dTDP-4-dehydrorhamnose 3,5-epimerase